AAGGVARGRTPGRRPVSRRGHRDRRGRMTTAVSRKPPKAAEQLAEQILRHIVEHGLQPGTRLAPERKMLADTGRARGTLREALRLLESRGVVEVRPGAVGGAFVRKPQPADLGSAITAVLLL